MSLVPSRVTGSIMILPMSMLKLNRSSLTKWMPRLISLLWWDSDLMKNIWVIKIKQIKFIYYRFFFCLYFLDSIVMLYIMNVQVNCLYYCTCTITYTVTSTTPYRISVLLFCSMKKKQVLYYRIRLCVDGQFTMLYFWITVVE